MNLEQCLPIANHLWQSTVFAGLAGLATLAFRNNRARVRYSLWLAASCKFLIPFSILTALGGGIEWRAAAQPGLSHTMVVIDRVSRPFTTPDASSSARMTPGSESVNPAPAVACAVWAAGFLGIAWSWWIRWWRVRGAVRAASPVRLSTPIPIPVRSSGALLEPAIFGVFRPVLVLPDQIFRQLTPAEQDAVVAHELCHLRYRDNLAAAIHMCVETIFWFHPLVWWIGKRMVGERERACDQEVLQLGASPKVYAEGILKVCKLCLQPSLACVAGVTGSNLKQRIEEILVNRPEDRLSVSKRVALATAAVAAVGVPIGIGLIRAPVALAQTASPGTPRFEVASVRPCKNAPGRMRGGGDSSPGRLSTGCDLLADENHLGLIQRAYVRFAGGHANPFGVLRIKGGPGWIRSQMYRIDARAEGQPSREMMQGPMLQSLLEDRFKLKVHREISEGPVYELVQAKGAARLKAATEGSCVPMPLTIPPPAPPSGQRFCKARVSLLGPSIDAEGSTLTEFSRLLNLVLDRPVIDRTGVAGRFDLHLEFVRDEATPGLRGLGVDGLASAADPNGPTIFTAIQEQLGLKLVPAKGPVETLVIDHVEKPSEN